MKRQHSYFAIGPKLTLFLILFGLLSGCQKEKADTPKTAHESAAVAIDWYKLQLRMILNANPATNGAINAECFGYVGIGLYESVRNGIKNAQSLSKTLNQMPEMPQIENQGYSWTISANAALASLIRAMYPNLTDANKASIDSLEKAYNEKLSPSMQSEVFSRSQAFGRAVATAVYNWAKTDNYNISNAGYVPPVFAGAWVPTPPLFANAALPFISTSRPLLLENGSNVSPAPSFTYSELPASDFYKMAKDVYDVSKTLTTEQKNIALYWTDLGIGIGYTPQGHNMNVAIQAIEQNNCDLGKAAEAFAKSGIAIREAHLTCFRSKFKYNILRPVSYIVKVIDKDWLPLIPTPPYPEYPAAHPYVGGATLQALASVLGPNAGVTDHTYDFRGFAPRSFSSLDKVAEESGASRRYGGIHYLPSIVAGLSAGRALGATIGAIKLTDDQHSGK